MPLNWSELTRDDIVELSARDPVALLVLGAIEQHGPHLPLATDCLIGEGLLKAAAERLDPDFPLLVLPTLALGASREHEGFPGTLSLPAPQLHDQLVAIGEGLSRAGIRRLVLLNAHGGNIGWMEEAALALRSRFGLLVIKASYMRFKAPEELLGTTELRDGLHGGLAETAMMRHLAPGQVRMDRALRFQPSHPHESPLPPQGEASWAWLAEDLNPEGVVGDAAAATPELGKQLIEHYAHRLAGVLEASQSKAWPIER